MNKARFLAGFLGLLAGAGACSKDDPPSVPGAEAPAATEATEATSAGPTATALASASASALPSALAPASAQSPWLSPSRASAHSPAPAKAADTDASAACGDKPLPPCPLNAWMKANASPASIAQDFEGLATAFDKVVTFAPTGYPNWASIARDGADAARAQSLDGAKAACRGCHTQYKDRYKKEMRDRPI
jgi:hypothetical protein